MKPELWILGTLERISVSKTKTPDEKWALRNAYGDTIFSREYQINHFKVAQIGDKIEGRILRDKVVNYHLTPYANSMPVLLNTI